MNVDGTPALDVVVVKDRDVDVDDVEEVVEDEGDVVDDLGRLRAAYPPTAIMTITTITIATVAVLLIACLTLEYLVESMKSAPYSNVKSIVTILLVLGLAFIVITL